MLRRHNTPPPRTAPGHCGIKLAQQNPSHRMCGIKLALLARNGPIWRVFRMHGELCTVFATNELRRANFFTHKAQQHGNVETNNTTAHSQQGNAETDITTATENCTKNTHFAPAKAMTVSTHHRHEQAKATEVSDNRPSWPTGSGGGTHGWRRGRIGTYSHAIPPCTLHALKCNH